MTSLSLHPLDDDTGPLLVPVAAMVAAAPHPRVMPLPDGLTAHEATIAMQASAIGIARSAFLAVEGYMHPTDHAAFVEDWSPVAHLDTAASDTTARAARERFDTVIAAHDVLGRDHRALLSDYATLCDRGASPLVAENMRRMRAALMLITALGGEAGAIAERTLADQVVPTGEECWGL